MAPRLATGSIGEKQQAQQKQQQQRRRSAAAGAAERRFGSGSCSRSSSRAKCDRPGESTQTAIAVGHKSSSRGSSKQQKVQSNLAVMLQKTKKEGSEKQQ
jgi:hypothetical protein